MKCLFIFLWYFIQQIRLFDQKYIIFTKIEVAMTNQTHMRICLHWKIAIFRNFRNIAKLFPKIDLKSTSSTGYYYIGVYTKAKRVFRKYGISQVCAFFIFLKTVLFWADFPPFCHILGTKISTFSRKFTAIPSIVWRFVIF